MTPCQRCERLEKWIHGQVGAIINAMDGGKTSLAKHMLIQAMNTALSSPDAKPEHRGPGYCQDCPAKAQASYWPAPIDAWLCDKCKPKCAECGGTGYKMNGPYLMTCGPTCPKCQKDAKEKP